MIDGMLATAVIVGAAMYIRERAHRLRLSSLADSLNTKLGDAERVCEELTRALCDERGMHVEMKAELENYRREDVARARRLELN